MDTMRWTQPSKTHDGAGPPTIKNHSVTYFGGYLYCFGGYDGKRNHMTLLLYSIKDQIWIPTTQSRMNSPTQNNKPGVAAVMSRRSVGYQDIQSIIVDGTPPPGRNGHTATLATYGEGINKYGRIIIIGGWLGSGPLAASDVHVLDVSGDSTILRWDQPEMLGTPPGPCNMHSADFVSKRREVYVFRGGNGREYLNDLHALDVDTYRWRLVETTGCLPQQRANHSSAYLEETDELFIFGGWNGRERLNDIHILDTETSTWSRPHVGGVLPHPRAGMTLTALRGRLFLFGGSGTSSRCFQDLQILDRKKMAWLDVEQNESNNLNNNEKRSCTHGASSYRRQHNSVEDDIHYSTLAAAATPNARLTDWRSRDRTNTLHATLPNPNDEESVPTVILQGDGPGHRAGHTTTVVNRRLYVFGGSCGSDYLNDFFLLDTDPPPEVLVTESASVHLFERRLCHFLNEENFSDVTFVVEGQRVFGHKLVLSIVSDCFRAMFTTGFRESEANAEISIPDVSYNAFLAMMEYIYTGLVPPDLVEHEQLHKVADLLELADQFFLDNLKQNCELLLEPHVSADTVQYLREVALKTNASQLLGICEHYLRNEDAARS
mmetsp:Transcript_23008/g.33959  ORF Transcript_23008/g.33959 Transcript_23008/m.33959 type:complete len:604 (+) Transcript_23008:356-2167(+)